MTYDSGAKRSDKLPHFRDLPLSLLTRGAAAFLEGADKYEKDFANPLDKNWRKGDMRFAADAMDHAFNHLLHYIENLRRRSLGLPFDNSEDHLGHLVANLGMLSEFEEAGYFDVPEEKEELPGEVPWDEPDWDAIRKNEVEYEEQRSKTFLDQVTETIKEKLGALSK